MCEYLARRQSSLADVTQRGALRRRHATQREAMCVHSAEQCAFCNVCTAVVSVCVAFVCTAFVYVCFVFVCTASVNDWFAGMREWRLRCVRVRVQQL